jgi:phenylacetate-CoA ligase
MSFLQLKTVPGYPWPALPDAVFAQVWNAYLELERTQWLDVAELERQQLCQARTLLAHCIANVPYYRRALPAAGIEPDAIRTMDDFRKIPLLIRRTYQEQHASFVAGQLPPGTSAGLTNQTSGSSGTPTSVYGTNMTSLWWHAFYLRDLTWSGIDPTGTLASIRHTNTSGPELERMLRGMSTPYWSAALDHVLETGTVHVMDLRQDPRVQLQWLRGIAPDYLLSFSANLEALALLARQDGPIPSLRGIQSFASTLTPEAKRLIEEVFGVPVKNVYSCVEAGSLASDCPDGHGMHVHAENVILEVLDENDRPCQLGRTGRVFITHLHNLRGPLIRYELGDEATVGPGRCPCGRGLPLLSRVQGKNEPMFPLPKGGTKNSAALGYLLRKLGGHWQHQVVQTARDRVIVRLATNAAWTERHPIEVERVVSEFFEAPMAVEMEIRDRLELPRSGKFQSMINAVEPGKEPPPWALS